VAAWFLAGIPTYYWRRQIMLERERIKTLAVGHTLHRAGSERRAEANRCAEKRSQTTG
jgi:hypothetical protein